MAENKAKDAAVDRVLAVSRHADGTPAQTPGFQSVAPEATKAISTAQLREQAVSAADYAIRADDIAGGTEPLEDPVNKRLREAHEAAAAAGEKQAQAEKV